MEVLIVVAIICVLVAIAIPVINASIEKARVAADAATMRAAKAAFAIQAMTGEKPQERAVYDNISGTFIEWGDYEKAGKFKTYKYYGQSYNPKAGRDTSGKNYSRGTNGHIYVDVFAEKEHGKDYGPETLVWWAEDKNKFPERWRD